MLPIGPRVDPQKLFFSRPFLRPNFSKTFCKLFFADHSRRPKTGKLFCCARFTRKCHNRQQEDASPLAVSPQASAPGFDAGTPQAVRDHVLLYSVLLPGLPRGRTVLLTTPSPRDTQPDYSNLVSVTNTCRVIIHVTPSSQIAPPVLPTAL